MRSVNLAARALPLAAATVLLQPSAALADESEFWIELAAKGDIAEGTSLAFSLWSGALICLASFACASIAPSSRTPSTHSSPSDGA